MSELLVEIGCEEIPARLLEGARAELGDRLRARLAERRLDAEEVRTWATPRRLAVAARVPERQPDRSDEILGPPASVAFDDAGRPTKAAEGFARKQGVPVDALERWETERGTYLGLQRETPGRPAREVLPDAIEEAIRGLSWPKTMRWGRLRERFIRPVHWLVALLDGEPLAARFADVEAGRTTRGHRFLAPEPFEVGGLDDWLQGLRTRWVEPDPDERRRRVEEGARERAAAVGGEPELDPGLVEEIVGLVEWPVPLVGAFDESFLELPPQVLATSMKHHQFYLPIRRADGGLRPHFVVVAALEAEDPSVVVSGNERVLRARLADARFFWDQDVGHSLDAHVEALSGQVFLQGLGTVADKARRLERLAPSLAGELAPDGAGAEHAGRAGRLAKADLATEMVGEFPELQGEMGAEYARHAGEEEPVVEAIREHLRPRHAGDELPRGSLGTVVALADRLDTLVGCFAIGLEPSGSADPYALRRQALGVVRMLEQRPGRIGFARALDLAHVELQGQLPETDWGDLRPRLEGFFRGRMKAALSREHPADLVEAVLEAGHDDPAEVRARLEALRELQRTEGWADLATAVKRVGRIVGEAASETPSPEGYDEDAARALHEACDRAEREVDETIAGWDYRGALEAAAGLRPAIDRFFDEVMVMTDDEGARTRRLGLLARVRSLFRRLADFDRVSTRTDTPTGDEER